jgi:hypothetical protein
VSGAAFDIDAMARFGTPDNASPTTAAEAAAVAATSTVLRILIESPRARTARLGAYSAPDK